MSVTAPAAPAHGAAANAVVAAVEGAAAGGGGGVAGRQKTAAVLGTMTSSTAHTTVHPRVPGKVKHLAQTDQRSGDGKKSPLGPMDGVNGLGGCCSFKDITARPEAVAASCSYSNRLSPQTAHGEPLGCRMGNLYTLSSSMEEVEGGAKRPMPAQTAAAADACFFGMCWKQDEVDAMARAGWDSSDVAAIAASLAGWDFRPSDAVISALVRGYSAAEAKGLMGPGATSLNVLLSRDFCGLCTTLTEAVVKQGQAESTLSSADRWKAVPEARFVFTTAYAHCRVARPASAAPASASGAAAAAAARRKAGGMPVQDKQPTGACSAAAPAPAVAVAAAAAGGAVAGVQDAAYVLNSELQPRRNAPRRKGAKVQTTTAGTPVMDAADLAKAAAAAEAVAAQLIAEEEENALAVAAAAAASKRKAKGRARPQSQQPTARAKVGAAQDTVLGKKQGKEGAANVSTEEKAAVGGDSARHLLPAAGGAYGEVGMHELQGEARALLQPGPEALLKPRHGAEAVPAAANTTAGSMETAALTSPAAAAKLGAGHPAVAVAKGGGTAAAAIRGYCEDESEQLGAAAGGSDGHKAGQPAAKTAAARAGPFDQKGEQLRAATSAAKDDVSALVAMSGPGASSVPAAVADNNGAALLPAACRRTALGRPGRQGPSTPLALQDLIISFRSSSRVSSNIHSQQVSKASLAVACLQEGAADAADLLHGSSSKGSGVGVGNKAGPNRSASSSSRGAEAAEGKLSTAEPLDSGALVAESGLPSTASGHHNISARSSCNPSLGRAANPAALGNGSSCGSSKFQAGNVSEGYKLTTALQGPVHHSGSSRSSGRPGRINRGSERGGNSRGIFSSGFSAEGAVGNSRDSEGSGRSSCWRRRSWQQAG